MASYPCPICPGGGVRLASLSLLQLHLRNHLIMATAASAASIGGTDPAASNEVAAGPSDDVDPQDVADKE